MNSTEMNRRGEEDQEYPTQGREGGWAQPVERITVDDLPAGAFHLNVEGRQLVSPLQGFGQLWRKIYRVRLSGIQATPEEVLQTWKENFARFQPPEIHFHPPAKGIRPGEFMPIDFMLPLVPGLPEFVPTDSGVSIVYSDALCFTVMTPEGFPISGWNTFAVYEEDGTVTAAVQSLLRATDPVYEFGMRFLGGAKKQENDWITVLSNLAKHYGIEGYVQVTTSILDPQVQWRYAKNVVHNASIRTFFYNLAAPFRWTAGLLKR